MENEKDLREDREILTEQGEEKEAVGLNVAPEAAADEPETPQTETEEPERSDPDEEPAEHPDYAQQLADILHSDIPVEEKKERLQDFHDNDIADTLPLLTKDERLRLYRLMGAEAVAEVFAYLEDPEEYVRELDIEKAADIVENMDADDAVDFLEELPESQQDAILAHMDAESRRDIALIQSYDEDEIGSKMTTNYIAVLRGVSVKQAMRTLVDQAAENDNLQTIYVLNPDGTFHGAINLQDLIRAREFDDLESLVLESYPFVYDHESVSDCIEELKDYSEDSIPVLNSDKKLLGVITSQDLVEVVDDELGEDYAKFAGLTEEEDLHEPLLQSMKKRLPWLIVLLGLGLVVSTVVGVFEPVMSMLTILVAFQSLVLDMSGNCGTQSLAVTIRVLSDENLTRQGSPRRPVQRAGAGQRRDDLLRVLHPLRPAGALGRVVYALGHHRRLPDHRHDDLRTGRHADPDLLQQDRRGSRRGVGSAHHDAQRPDRGHHLLRPRVDVPDQHLPRRPDARIKAENQAASKGKSPLKQLFLSARDASRLRWKVYRTSGFCRNLVELNKTNRPLCVMVDIG